MILSRNLIRIHTRRYSKYIDNDKSGKIIRQKFLDFFINENNHNFVRSSPVVPYCDPTVAFVNAGMNQFKSILMGNQIPHYKRIANSQKCIRVGGKHNDLNVVGTDGYHHTFFEMLGNWSFGDYFKKESCEMAWNLLTNVYKIPQSRLYVTYFKGNSELGIGEDLETKEIWKSIGVPEERILAFGAKENFWEMGLSGPCGPCTEIHIDHVGGKSRADFINKGLHDLTELWNIVFIQYKRNEDKTIDLLPEKHVDTGMGFERLTATLQGKISNYDTDNFNYLLKAIHKNCRKVPEYSGKFGESDWNNLDTSYRILCDHSRMITACLADGVIPEQNQKLRRIMRKVFLISEQVFGKQKGLLKELSNYVIENLGPIYSEMERKSGELHQIIDYEEEVFQSFRKTAMDEWNKMTKDEPKLLGLDIFESPSLVAAYKELKLIDPKSINDALAFKLYDTFGLDKETILSLSQVLELEFDQIGLEKQLEMARIRSKQQNILTKNIIYDKLKRFDIPKTDTSTKYNYHIEDGKYKFENVDVKILKVIENLEIVPEITPEVYCSIVLDKSNLYTDAGGQISDQGTILFEGSLFEVVEAQNCDGYILHKGFLHSDKNYRLKIGDEGILFVDSEFRLKTMRNHTAAHLLNAAIKDIKGATCQKSSRVTDGYLNLDLAIFGNKINLEEIHQIEGKIKNLIQSNIPVKINELDSQHFLGVDDLTLIPGEIYPDKGIRVVEIVDNNGFVSREPCCGTHVANTSDINDFCVVSVKSLGRSTVSIHAVTGERAKIAKVNGIEMWDNIEKFDKNIRDNIDKPDMLNMTVSTLRQKLKYNIEDSSIMPLIVKNQCLETLNKISKQIKDSAKENLKEFIEMEMQNAIESNMSKTKSNQKYMVHYLRSSMILESVPLQRATKLCPDIPILVISYSDNMVKARCCVPECLRGEHFNAEKWLKETVAQVFNSNTAPPKGYDSALVCNMRAKRVNIADWDPLLNESLELAKKFIEDHL